MDISEVIRRAITLGMSIDKRIHCPEDDYISQSRAERYLSELGYSNPRKVIRFFHDEGKIHIHNPVGSSNAKSRISVYELNRALLEQEISKLV